MIKDAELARALGEVRSGFDWDTEELALQVVIRRIIALTWEASGEGYNAEYCKKGNDNACNTIYESLGVNEK